MSETESSSPPEAETISPERVRETLAAMEAIAKDRRLLDCLDTEDFHRFASVAGELYCPDVRQRRLLLKARRKQQRREKIDRDEELLHETGIRSLRRKPVFTTPNCFPPKNFEQIEIGDEPGFRDVLEPRNCYICKQDYQRVHHFYDQLCPGCAELNYRKRTETADLSGRVALLTGGRVKIGYQAGIKLLRAGASLIVTTRFPRDGADRYAQEADFEEWRDRLEIYGIDLRHTPSVEAFCKHLLKTRKRLDFIVNNACQTVRRPPDFYQHMMERENADLKQLPAEVRRVIGAYEGLRGYHLLPEGEAALVGQSDHSVAGLTHAAALSQATLLPEEREAQRHLFPAGRLDQDRQQVDLRAKNSWRLMLDEVPAVELLEVQLVNAVAPFVMNARLKPLLLAGDERDRHIVNVSAVEGQFYRKFKTTRHPHTNMAKAALNMMTRTSAADYQADGIHMNSVDTGWVTDEDPRHIAERKTDEHRFHPPLDIVDGAARIVDPIIDGINTGRHIWGKFLKDYKPTDW